DHFNLDLPTAAIQAETVADEECPEEGISHLPQPDCTRYIVCIYGQRNHMVCPGSLYYNPVTSNCEFQENVPECVGGTRPPVINGTTSTFSDISTTALPTDVPTSTTTVPPNTITQCGHTIQQDSGFIEYKLYQSYEAGELCAFIIRLDKYTGCDFTLETHGISDTKLDTITIFQVLDEQATFPSVKFETIGSTVNLPGSTFVVVFKTETNLGTGFRLRFESSEKLIEKTPGVPLVFNNHTENPLRFPLHPNAAAKAEWDPIVITSGSKLITETKSSLRLQVYDYFVSPGCRSWFSIHSFDGTNTKFEGRVCGLNGGKTVLAFNTRGLFIVVFYKNDNTVEKYLGSLEWLKTSTI
ncbi:putative chitinase 3, partial [Orchesella cincta]